MTNYSVHIRHQYREDKNSHYVSFPEAQNQLGFLRMQNAECHGVIIKCQ